MSTSFRTNLLLIFLLGFSNVALAAGEIKGVVSDKKSGAPLPGTNIIVVGTKTGAAAGPNGRFIISRLPDGVYILEASILGYERKRIEGVAVNGDAGVEVNFELAIEAIPLSEVIVTPGHFSMMQKGVTVKQTLKPEDIRSFPQLGEDVYRAVTRLPGLTGSDFSSNL